MIILSCSLSMCWQTVSWCSQSENHRHLTAGVELFDWQEFDPNTSKRLLSEHGARLTLQAGWDNLRPVERFGPINFKTRIYSGAIDYDGQTQSLIDPSKTGIFVATTSRYIGLGAELEKLYPLKEQRNTNLLLALGVDFWRRNIQKNIDAQGNPVAGASEDYLGLYSRLGLQWQNQNTFGESQARFGIKYPLRIDERTIDIILHPQPSLSLFAAYRLDLADTNHTIIELYYDSLRLDTSPVVYDKYGSPWLQPKSQQNSVGIMIGIPF